MKNQKSSYLQNREEKNDLVSRTKKEDCGAIDVKKEETAKNQESGDGGQSSVMTGSGKREKEASSQVFLYTNIQARCVLCEGKVSRGRFKDKGKSELPYIFNALHYATDCSV